MPVPNEAPKTAENTFQCFWTLGFSEYVDTCFPCCNCFALLLIRRLLKQYGKIVFVEKILMSSENNIKIKNKDSTTKIIKNILCSYLNIEP